MIIFRKKLFNLRTHVILVFVPKETNCFKLAPLEYANYLADMNGGFIQKNRETLEPISDFLKENGICAIAVGSDGKGEKHNQSSTEIIYVQDQDRKQRLNLNEIVNKFESETGGKEYKNFFFVGENGIPKGMIIGQHILSLVDGISTLTYPDRVLNSMFVCGNELLYQDARKTVAIEMGQTPKLSRKIRGEIRRQIKNYISTCKTGISRGVVCFDKEKQYYDENKNPGEYGFKHSHLRLTQRELDLITQTFIRDKKINVSEDIRYLPTRTIDRINYFFKKEISLTEAYLWFLQRYHEIQELYKNEKEPVSLEYDHYVFNLCSEIILKSGENVLINDNLKNK